MLYTAKMVIFKKISTREQATRPQKRVATLMYNVILTRYLLLS